MNVTKQNSDPKAVKMKVLANASSSKDIKASQQHSTVRALMGSTARDDPKDMRAFEKALESMPMTPKLEVQDYSASFPVNLMISSKMEKREVKVPRALNVSVKDFKEQHFENEMSGGSIGVRLIYNGKEMRDSHTLSDHHLTDNCTIYVFFFKKEDKVRRETTLANKSEVDIHNITDTDALDFDYFKEKQNLSVAQSYAGRRGRLEKVLLSCAFYI